MRKVLPLLLFSTFLWVSSLLGQATVKVTGGAALTLGTGTTLTSEQVEVGTGSTLSLPAGTTLQLTSDLVNDGTLSGAGTLAFTGSGAQALSGNAISIDGLTRSGGGTLTLGADATVNATLALTSGRINIGSQLLTLGAGASITGTPSATNMIVAEGAGYVRKNFNAAGSFTYPVGDATSTAEYSPITLNFTSGTFGGGAYAQVSLANAKHPNNTSTTDFINRYWTVEQSGITGFNCDVQFTYTDADIDGSETGMIGGRYTLPLGPWTPLGPVNAAQNRIEGTVSSFSQFTGGQPGPLPVTWLNFTAKALPAVVKLDWATASEINNSYFGVERSADLNAFAELGRVNGSGTTTAESSYAYNDDAPLRGANYYRLRQVDYDGVFDYSPTRVVVWGEDNEDVMIAYPIPARTELQVVTGGKTAQKGTAVLIDGQGIEVRRLPLDATGAALINVVGLSSGAYTLQLRTAKNAMNAKVVVQ